MSIPAIAVNGHAPTSDDLGPPTTASTVAASAMPTVSPPRLYKLPGATLDQITAANERLGKVLLLKSLPRVIGVYKLYLGGGGLRLATWTDTSRPGVLTAVGGEKASAMIETTETFEAVIQRSGSWTVRQQMKLEASAYEIEGFEMDHPLDQPGADPFEQRTSVVRLGILTQGPSLRGLVIQVDEHFAPTQDLATARLAQLFGTTINLADAIPIGGAATATSTLAQAYIEAVTAKA
ncbi:hypothetical protein PYCC9005_004480 [Savitreella phatthalungensis]